MALIENRHCCFRRINRTVINLKGERITARLVCVRRIGKGTGGGIGSNRTTLAAVGDYGEGQGITVRIICRQLTGIGSIFIGGD